MEKDHEFVGKGRGVAMSQNLEFDFKKRILFLESLMRSSSDDERKDLQEEIRSLKVELSRLQQEGERSCR